ncbi:MAG: ATP-binding protein [Acidobacteriota bacterium]
MTTSPDPSGLANLPAALDLAALEYIGGGLFRPVGALPAWLHLPAGSEIDPGDRYPLLEMFLAELDPAWQGVSDIWTEPDTGQGEMYLQATAAEVDGRRFLVLKSLPKALYTLQQLAHDFELEKEKVERLSRELELKRREAERATEAKSEFLARMSHEIRTPLNSVIGMADVLSATELTAHQRRCVEVSQRNGIGLLNLINDILDLTKVASGKVELESVHMDLRSVIAGAMEVVEARAAAKGLWLRQEIAPGVPVYLAGDPNRLRQILINLLGNSIKFTETGGIVVQVGLDPEDDTPGRLRFAVTDTGIGIPPDKVTSVFESFAQADTSTTRKYGGTGLGLTISKQLVELMGGRIRVESTVGTGSSFIFTAAFGAGEEQPDMNQNAGGTTGEESKPDEQATTREPEQPTRGMRILIADDSEDNRFLILSYLKRRACAIEVAEDGAQALELFRRNRYDVVLMDVEMPVMDGYTATREIRAWEKARGLPPTPVLALTAHAFADMAAKGFEAGFTDLLTKPIRSATLMEALVRYGTRGPDSRAPGIKVRVEEGMEDVVPGYLAKRRAEVPVYREALAGGDMAAIRVMAHRMKGTGAGYGFQTLTELGGAMEKAANSGDTGEIRLRLEEFARYLDAVELEYI